MLLQRMKAIFTLVTVVLIPCVVSQEFTYTTIPPTDGGPAYVFADEGTSVSVFCQEFLNDAMIVVVWNIQQATENTFTRIEFSDDGVATEPVDLADEITVTGDNVTGFDLTFRSNLTITEFTAEYDRSMIRCGGSTSPDRRIFNFGFPILPSVLTITDAVARTENTAFTINLTVSGADDPFPPTTSSQWYFNGTAITDGNGITLMDYTITFTNATRDRSGNYTLRVSNDAGANTGSFVLDIQYGPQATQVGGTFTKSPESNFTLTAFTNITGNPQPMASWTGPNGPILTGGRLNVSVPGQLTIQNAMASDNGTYTCTVSNGIGNDLVQTVTLIVAVRPGPPRNVTATNVTDTSVILTWEEPLDLGTPPLTLYRIIIRPSLSPDILNTTDTSIYIEDKLIPGTVYNGSVVGVSTEGDNFNMLVGEESSIVTFETDTGAPDIETAVLTLTDTIMVSWSLRHNGGLEIEAVDIDCTYGSNVTGTSVMCMDSSCESNSITVPGPVLAGVQYECSVTVFNENGTDSMLTNTVTPSQGIPSRPMIVNITINDDVIVLTLRAAASGTTGTFTFVVIATNVDDSTTRTYNFMYSMYVSGSSVNAVITSITNGGRYMFTVMSSNEFGNSTAVVSDIISIAPATPSSSIGTTSSTVTSTAITTSVPTRPSDEPAPSSGLSGGAIGGIVVAIIIVAALVALVIIIVAYLIYRNRGGTYQVERVIGGGKGGVKVEELDIDIGTELQDKSTEETSAPTNKPELHYADLDHFAKKQKSDDVEPMAKPTPIEEVQYAKIQANKQ